jgi:hypothetical protein
MGGIRPEKWTYLTGHLHCGFSIKLLQSFNVNSAVVKITVGICVSMLAFSLAIHKSILAHIPVLPRARPRENTFVKQPKGSASRGMNYKMRKFGARPPTTRLESPFRNRNGILPRENAAVNRV